MQENPQTFSKELTQAELGSIGLPEFEPNEEKSLLDDIQADSEEVFADAIEADTSDEEDVTLEAEQDDSLDSDIEDDNIEEIEENEDLSDEDKKIKAAERQMRDYQSKYDAEKARNDNLSNQFEQLVNQFNNLRDQTPVEQEVDLSSLTDALGDDDELVYVKDVIKHVGKNMKTSSDGKLQKDLETDQQNKNIWLNQQSELSDVRSFINANTAGDNSKLSNIPTDSVGLFHVIKAQMLQKQLAELKKAHKKALSKATKRKTPIPPTTGARATRTRSNGTQMGEMERMFASFGKKIGRDMTAKQLR